jgi:cytochrome c
VSSFDRYSDALKSSGIVWDDRALDGWLTDPQGMVPDNDMPFEGIKDARVRADLVAFLEEATKPGAAQQTGQQGGMNGMGGMMGGGRDPNLKNLELGKRVKAITYCRDTYRVTTADGKTRSFWERNLRFRTDSGKDGPDRDAPAITPAGMMGDRAAVIFLRPGRTRPFHHQALLGRSGVGRPKGRIRRNNPAVAGGVLIRGEEGTSLSGTALKRAGLLQIARSPPKYVEKRVLDDPGRWYTAVVTNRREV